MPDQQRIKERIKEHSHSLSPNCREMDRVACELALLDFVLSEIAEAERSAYASGMNPEWEEIEHTLRHVVAMLTHQKHILKKIMATQAEIDAALQKVDAATNKLAANVQVIADTDQKISDEIDAFLKGAPAGTVLTDAQVAQLQALSDKAQATSDASDAQVAVLQAIAVKGAGNPVPVPVPPAPTP